MKVIQSFLFSIVILICAANSCDPNEDGHWDGRLTIVNNSNDTIISFLQYNFPDTILLDENAPELNNIIITPNSLGKHYSSIKWEDHISSLNTHKTILIFINSYDTIRKYSWTQIQDDYNILRRYDLTIDSLQKLDWIITYP